MGDRAVLFTLGNQVDADVNARVLALARATRGLGLPGIVDVVPAYASFVVHYDPRAWISAGRAPAAALAAALESRLSRLSRRESVIATDRSSARERVIPTAYGGRYGPDLELVARQCGLTTDDVIARHCAAVYTVAFIGFAPGFPYLLGLDEALVTPRRATPRARVEPGAVGIAANQTGVYPLATPGGWQIIGRTPRRLFDAARDPPTWLAAGDRVRFVPIAAAAFESAEVAWDD